MVAKLALRNIRRSLNDYVIYFVTLTLTAALMDSFLAMGLSQDILSLSENMSILTSGILILSLLVALITSCVIGFAVRFMLDQRKKEFAIYELLGMDNGSIQKLFLMENILIGILAFFFGVLLGTALSGLLVQLVNNIFHIPHRYQIFFSMKAAGIALLLFAVMYAFGIFRAAAIIRKSKIVDLLYDNCKNEWAKSNRVFVSVAALIFSSLFMITGGGLLSKGISIQTNDAIFFMGGAMFFIVIGIYGIYRNVPFLLLICFKNSKKTKYKNANLFFFGQIGHRVQSAGRLMAVTAILLTVSLSTMFIGLSMGASYEANIKADYPYDVGVALDAPLTKECMDPIVGFINEKCPVQDHLIYYLYTAESYPIEALSLSDYNHLRQILGLEQVELESDRFMVHCDTWNYISNIEKALEETPGIMLANTLLFVSDHAVFTEPMEQYQMAGTNGYVLIIPDAVAAQLSGNKTRLVMKLEDGGAVQLRQEIQNYLNSEEWQPQLQSGTALPEHVTMKVTVKAWGIANSLTGFAAISFCGLYLSIIFIILSCTILAFEQLSALDRNRRSYRILDDLGVEKETQFRLAEKEVGTFFLIPAVLPISATVVLIFATDRLFGKMILQKNLIPIYGGITILIFAFLYAIYFRTTVSIFKRAVLGDLRRSRRSVSS